MNKTAELLEVDIRTVRNWENGSTKIPYSAFKLVRLLGGYAILGKGWEEWSVYDGKLFSPSGRSFLPHELHYVSHFISMARLYLKNSKTSKPDSATSERAKARRDAAESNSLVQSDLDGKASTATAVAGVSPCHDTVVINVDFSQQKKTNQRIKSQSELMFGRFSSYRRAAANEAYYG